MLQDSLFYKLKSLKGSEVEDILVVSRRLEVGVESNHFCDEGVALLLNLLPSAILAGVQPFALTVVDGLWRRRPTRRQNTRRTTMTPFYKQKLFHLQPNRLPKADYDFRMLEQFAS